MTSSPLLALLCAGVLLQSCAVIALIQPSNSNISSLGYKIVIAPSTQINLIAGLETREQGATAWICSSLDASQPWAAYADIRGYLEGGNGMKKDYSALVLFPVMELTHKTANNSKLCVYLPSVDHCFPPTPSSRGVVPVKQLMKRTYYSIRFWGQASDVRVAYYKGKLIKAITDNSKKADLDLFFLSYFPDHVKEVRYDKKPSAPQNQ